MINNNDLDELRRMATNLYDAEKARINRILKGIADLVAENHRLKSENEKLRKPKDPIVSTKVENFGKKR